MPRSRSSLLAGFGAALLLPALAVVVPAAPAAAASFKSIVPVTLAYTDSRQPHTSFIDATRDAPVGAWRDERGKVHKSRSYFTFDLSQFTGVRVLHAELGVRETGANDCATTRNWELWITDPITSRTSWVSPPRERKRIALYGGEGCPAYQQWRSVSDAVRDAIARRQHTLTLELRVPHRFERNLLYGRRVANNPVIFVETNVAPGAPAGLTIDNMACAGEVFTSSAQPVIEATVDDPDGSALLTPTFAIWPRNNPAARVEWEASSGISRVGSYIPAGLVEEGVPYAVAVRVRDETDTSPWSAECHFTSDQTRPTTSPTVESTDYPSGWGNDSGGPGIPGAFTFDPAGVADVAGYVYYTMGAGSQYVAAPALGAPVTVTITPTMSDRNILEVRSVDRAGNVSDPPTIYEFWVRFTAPIILDANPDAWAGDPHQLTFRPNMADVVSYTYRVDDGAEQTVAAGPDGSATVPVVPDLSGSTVYVFSTTASGQRSPENWAMLMVRTEPFVTSANFPLDGTNGPPVGTTGVFAFAPHMHNVVSYVYQFNRYQVDEQPTQTVTANADGTATVTFTPTRWASNTLHVYSVTADGTVSMETGVSFISSSIAPVVTSATYPNSQPGGGPGVPGIFTFAPVAANVVAYDYQFYGDPEHTVTANADGTASIEYTPTYVSMFGGWTSVMVRSRSAGGLVSDWAYYSFQMRGLEPSVQSDVYNFPAGGNIGEPATFTLTAELPGSVEFLYGFDGEAERSVAVGSDGTATVTWTPASPHHHNLTVRSRTATGLSSGYRFVPLWVSPL